MSLEIFSLRAESSSGGEPDVTTATIGGGTPLLLDERPVEPALSTRADAEPAPYPRLADMLDRMKAERAPVHPRIDTSAGRSAANAVVVDVVAPEIATLPAPMRNAVARLDGQVEVHPAQPPAAGATPDVMVGDIVPLEDLGVRELAREALRARIVQFGAAHKQRSAYELVFIMLAFAVTVLLTAPPMIQILLAAHGTRP